MQGDGGDEGVYGGERPSHLPQFGAQFAPCQHNRQGGGEDAAVETGQQIIFEPTLQPLPAGHIPQFVDAFLNFANGNGAEVNLLIRQPVHPCHDLWVGLACHQFGNDAGIEEVVHLTCL